MIYIILIICVAIVTWQMFKKVIGRHNEAIEEINENFRKVKAHQQEMVKVCNTNTRNINALADMLNDKKSIH